MIILFVLAAVFAGPITALYGQDYTQSNNKGVHSLLESAGVLAALCLIQPPPGRVQAQRERLDEAVLDHRGSSASHLAASAAK